MWAVTVHMSQWRAWYLKLKNTAALLTRPNLMRRVIAVISTGPLPHCTQVFHETAPALHEERWQVVQNYIDVALPQLMVLKQVWTTSMLHSGRQEKEFDSALFHDTLHDDFFFFSYLRMVQLLESNVQWWTRWSEGCGCHEVFRCDLREWTQAERKQRLRTELGAALTCPVANMRLPELTIILLGLLLAQRLGRANAQDIHALQELRLNSRVSDQDHAMIVQDFQAALQEIEVILHLKLGYAALLPYSLAGLAYPDPAVVSKVSKICIDQFDQLGQAQRELLPSNCQKLLQQGSTLRNELQMVANGLHISQASLRLRRSIAVLRFPCLSERAVEAGHKDIKKGHGYSRFAGLSASLVLRTNVLVERSLDLYPDFMSELLASLGSLYSRTKESLWRIATRKIHLAKHPSMLALARSNAHNTKWMEVFQCILYRTDSHSTFRNLAALGATHAERTRRLHGLIAKLWKAKEPATLEAYAAEALLEHSRSKVVEGDILLLPAALNGRCVVDPVATLPENDVFEAIHMCTWQHVSTAKCFHQIPSVATLSSRVSLHMP
eukprot:4606566-Amphidinium_carterae.5